MDARADLDPAGLLKRLLDLDDVSDVWTAIQQVCTEQDSATLLAAGIAWCDDVEPSVQATGLDLLGALALTVPAARDGLLDRSTVLLGSREQTVRWTIAINVGWGENSRDPRSIPLLIDLLRDSDAEVRRRAVVGLNIPLDGEPVDGPVVQAMITAMHDPDEAVRDWATFSIGTQREVDTPEVRNILIERLSDDDDTDADTPAEAAVGLARRGDARVLEPILDRLASMTIGNLWVEAAMELGDPRLLPALLRLQEHHWPDTESDAKSLSGAIARCSASRTTSSSS